MPSKNTAAEPAVDSFEPPRPPSQTERIARDEQMLLNAEFMAGGQHGGMDALPEFFVDWLRNLAAGNLWFALCDDNEHSQRWAADVLGRISKGPWKLVRLRPKFQRLSGRQIGLPLLDGHRLDRSDVYRGYLLGLYVGAADKQRTLQLWRRDHEEKAKRVRKHDEVIKEQQAAADRAAGEIADKVREVFAEFGKVKRRDIVRRRKETGEIVARLLGFDKAIPEDSVRKILTYGRTFKRPSSNSEK